MTLIVTGVLAGAGLASGPDTQPAQDPYLDYYTGRIGELGMDQATGAKVLQKVPAVRAALTAWGGEHAKQVSDLEQAIEAAAGAKQDGKVVELEAQIQPLHDQRGALAQEKHGAALAALSEQDRAAWYALDLRDLGMVFAEELGGRLNRRDEWALIDAARAKGQELAKVQDPAALAKAVANACQAITDLTAGAVSASLTGAVSTRKARRGPKIMDIPPQSPRRLPTGSKPRGSPGAGQPSAKDQEAALKDKILELELDIAEAEDVMAALEKIKEGLIDKVAELQKLIKGLQRQLAECQKHAA
jgi:hypothetical protein